MAEVEHSAKARPADAPALRVIPIRRAIRPFDQLPFEALVNAPGMALRREFLSSST
jgi:hypothetical protein